MSISDLQNLFGNLSINRETYDNTMNADQVKALLDAAISAATEAQRTEFIKKVDELTRKIESLTTRNVTVEKYEEAKILDTINCSESLDVVKSIPDFEGKLETYVSWRQAAHTAYKVFAKYDGSSKHYQAVAIIRNKIKGSADAVLSSFNTVLNFSAIIARLDSTYADKRPIHLIEQELSTLRQGSYTVSAFYDLVEQKLSLLTNKTMMSYEDEIALTINDKYRRDALRVFISGLRKPLCDILFAARTTDLPSALALAQEVESNHERYVFATAFANRTDGRQKQDSRQRSDNAESQIDASRQKNPYYKKYRNKEDTPVGRQDQTEPMDVDPSSSRFRTRNFDRKQNNENSNGRYNFKRHPESDRTTGPKIQRVNHIALEGSAAQDEVPSEYQSAADTEAQDCDDEDSESTQFINFLVENPCYRL